MQELVLAAIVLLIGTVATVYLWRIEREDRRDRALNGLPPGWLLQTIAAAATVKLVIGAYFGALTLYRYTISLDLPPETRPISTLAVCILILAPVFYALRAYLRRRAARRARMKEEFDVGPFTREDPES